MTLIEQSFPRVIAFNVFASSVYVVDSKEILFKEHVEPHFELLLRAARNMANGKADAQDIVQETLIKAFRNIEKFDGRYPKAWLLTILRNTAIDYFRKRKPELLTDNEYFLENTSRYDFSTSDFLQDEFSEETIAAFQKLNQETQRLIVLVDVEGFSYAEAAVIQDIAPGTVMSRLHRGRNQIKEHLARKNITSIKEMP